MGGVPTPTGERDYVIKMHFRRIHEVSTETTETQLSHVKELLKCRGDIVSRHTGLPRTSSLGDAALSSTYRF